VTYYSHASVAYAVQHFKSLDDSVKAVATEGAEAFVYEKSVGGKVVAVE
jgi:hypothetical protein